MEPRWSPDGASVYFRWGGTLWRVEVDTSGSSLVAGRPREIATSSIAPGPNSPSYSVNGDGSRILSLAIDDRFQVDRLHYVSRWDREVAAAFSTRP